MVQKFKHAARIVWLRSFGKGNPGALRDALHLAALLLPARGLFRQLGFLQGDFRAKFHRLRGGEQLPLRQREFRLDDIEARFHMPRLIFDPR